MAKKTATIKTCHVCTHPERARIEMLRLAGCTADKLAEQFGVCRDSIYRHCKGHVSDADKAAMIADIPLSELAERAASESTSLLDHLALVRSTVMSQLIGAASINDRTAVASLARAGTDVLREIGRLTGELVDGARNITINNNTANFISSPIYVSLEAMLLQRLAPYPDALEAVVSGLDELQAKDRRSPALALPSMEAAYAAA